MNISKRILIVLSFCLFIIKAEAQHCPYDFSSMIVVSFYEENGNTLIENLKISLVDSLGNTILDNFSNKEIVFSQNKELLFEDYKSLPFDINYFYICGNSFPIQEYSLKIEEIADSPKYEITENIIKLYPNDKFHLCKNFWFKHNFPSSNRRIYKPIEVILKRKTETITK